MNIRKIATTNTLSPKEVYEVIAPTDKISSDNKPLPPCPDGDFGKKPLAELRLEYGLDCQQMVDHHKRDAS